MKDCPNRQSFVHLWLKKRALKVHFNALSRHIGQFNRAIIHENPSLKPVPGFSMLLSAFEIVSIKPIVLRLATIVDAARIKITTFENPSPINERCPHDNRWDYDRCMMEKHLIYDIIKTQHARCHHVVFAQGRRYHRGGRPNHTCQRSMTFWLFYLNNPLV